MNFRRVLAVAVVVVFITSPSIAQQDKPTFPKGELSTTKNHTGDIWLNELNVGDATFDPSVP